MPFPEPNRDVDAPRCPTARCSLPLLGSPCLFDADHAGIQAPRISNKPAVHRLFSSPRLACFCDVCAAQILSELELGNHFAVRSPNSMIPRSLKRSLRKLLDYEFDVLQRGDATHRLKSKHMDALMDPIDSTPLPTPEEDQDNKPAKFAPEPFQSGLIECSRVTASGF